MVQRNAINCSGENPVGSNLSVLEDQELVVGRRSQEPQGSNGVLFYYPALKLGAGSSRGVAPLSSGLSSPNLKWNWPRGPTLSLAADRTGVRDGLLKLLGCRGINLENSVSEEVHRSPNICNWVGGMDPWPATLTGDFSGLLHSFLLRRGIQKLSLRARNCILISLIILNGARLHPSSFT